MLHPTGDFTYASVAYSTPGNATDVKLGDYNGDGFVDAMVLANGGVSLYIGDGRGNFNSGPIVGANGNHFCVGDFNQDGRIDFAEVVNTQVYVYLNQ